MEESIGIDCDVRVSHVVEDSLPIIQQVRPTWGHQLKHKVFTDGITNKIVGFYLEEDNEWTDMVLVRIYGEKTELFINRQDEINTMKMLHKHGCSSQLYATFNNGIAYQFIPGQTLDCTTVRQPKVFPLVCSAMAKLHCIPNPNNNSSPEPVLWRKLQRFLDILPTHFTDPHKQQKFEKEVLSGSELSSECSLLRDAVRSRDSVSGGCSVSTQSVVFSHNDLLLANCILSRDEDHISFIDLEYADWNYQAFDIANHFNEYAGVDDVDYSLYPSHDYQMCWLRCYLSSLDGATSPPTTAQLESLYITVNLFSLASHLWWGLWALLQAKESSIDFDFLGYAILRLNEYLKRKEEVFSLKYPEC